MVRSTFCAAVMAGAFACLAADGRALAADASRVCFSTGRGGGVIELGVAKGRLAAPGYGLLAGQTYGPDRHVACFGGEGAARLRLLRPPRGRPWSGGADADSH